MSIKLVIPRPNLFQRAFKRIAWSRPGLWFLSRTLNRMERIVSFVMHRSLATLFAGLPVLKVTTRDSANGKPHTIPLISVPMGDDIILIASNWGRSSNPGWYRNVCADPTVTLNYHGESAEYVARVTSGPLREDCWRRAAEVYAGFEVYRILASPRLIPVMLLTPKAV